MPRKLVVAIDARQWGISGIGRYVQELCTNLTGIFPEIELKLFGPPAVRDQLTGHETIPYGAKMYSLSEQLFGGMKFRSGTKADLYHFLHYNVPIAPPRPFVVTVHDLTHFRFAHGFCRWKVALARRVLRRSVNRAARVICISQSTRSDLLEMFPNVVDKVVVIPQGVSSIFHPCSSEEIARFKRESGLGEYLLYVGSDRPHKGYQAAVAAFTLIRETRGELELVCVGQFTKPDPVEGVRYLGYVSDEALRCLYGCAGCLVFSSQYEGFGLPAVAAMACGCPVVCGGGSSLDEVCGEAAVPTDVGDPELLAKSVDGLLSNHTKRRQYAVRGLARAGMYSWGKMARATLAVYAEVAGWQAFLEPTDDEIGEPDGRKR